MHYINVSTIDDFCKIKDANYCTIDLTAKMSW